jgi:hypothetical protein
MKCRNHCLRGHNLVCTALAPSRKILTLLR